MGQQFADPMQPGDRKVPKTVLVLPKTFWVSFSVVDPWHACLSSSLHPENRKPMTITKEKAETILDQARRALSQASGASAVLAAGQAIPALIIEIETARDGLDDDIAAEAEAIDRARANALRAERSALGDLQTDAEYLERRIEEKHKALLKTETDAAMMDLRASALEKQAQAKAVVMELAGPLQTVVSAVEAYEALAQEISAINNQLRAAERNELCVRPPLHSVTERDENLGVVFDFLQSGRLTMPGVGGPNLLEVAARLKREAAGK